MTPADDKREPTVSDQARSALAAVRRGVEGALAPLSPREAAWIVHHRTGAEITPCTLHERAGDVPSWVVSSPHAHHPQIFDDGGLVAWAAELQQIENAHRTGHQDLAARS